MKQYILISFFCVWLLAPGARAQPLDKLDSLKNHTATVYFSDGHTERASAIARRVDKALVYYEQLLESKPVVTLLVLSNTDWTKYTTLPVVYGMPHYIPENKTLVVAAEDNPFWKSFLPALDKLPEQLRRQVQAVYKNEQGQLSMQAFFDLLALHELGHAFHFQQGLNMQRKWMGELFVNILLHTYIAENEPGSLPALVLFPKMVIGGGSSEFKFTSLRDVHERYEEIGGRYPKNYGWYQCRWHAAAGDIYDASGKRVGRKFWDALGSQEKVLNDQELVIFLNKTVDKTVGDMIVNWDRNTIQ